MSKQDNSRINKLIRKAGEVTGNTWDIIADLHNKLTLKKVTDVS